MPITDALRSSYEWLREADPVLGAVGFVLAIAGFWVALAQLAKTKRAAMAAKDAALKAQQEVRSVWAVTSLHEICSRSRDLLHLTRARNLAASANAAFELREALARFCATEQASGLMKKEQWLEVTSSVASIYERLESAASINRIDAESKTAMLHEIAAGHERLSSLAARIAQRGVANADSN